MTFASRTQFHKAFSVIVNLWMDLFEALVSTHQLVVVSHEALEVDKAADGGR